MPPYRLENDPNGYRLVPLHPGYDGWDGTRTPTGGRRQYPQTDVVASVTLLRALVGSGQHYSWPTPHLTKSDLRAACGVESEYPSRGRGAWISEIFDPGGLALNVIGPPTHEATHLPAQLLGR